MWRNFLNELAFTVCISKPSDENAQNIYNYGEIHLKAIQSSGFKRKKKNFFFSINNRNFWMERVQLVVARWYNEKIFSTIVILIKISKWKKKNRLKIIFIDSLKYT